MATEKPQEAAQDNLYDPNDIEVSGDALPQKAQEERPRNPDGTFSAFKEHVEPAKPDPLAKHAPYLVEAARDFGYSDDEIGEMSVNLLHKTMWQANRRQEAARSEALKFQTRENARVRPPEPATTPAEPEFDLGIDNEADYDPKLIGALKKLSKSHHDEVKALKDQLSQREQRDQDRDTRRTAAMIDAAFAALPEHKSLFGTGSCHEIAGTPEMQRRIAVLRSANIDMREIGSVGQLKAKIKSATETIFAPVMSANPYEAAAETPPTKPGKNGKQNQRISPEEWEEAALARPTQRKGQDLPKGEAFAVAELKKKMRDSGELIPDSEELEGFLD